MTNKRGLVMTIDHNTPPVWLRDGKWEPGMAYAQGDGNVRWYAGKNPKPANQFGTEVFVDSMGDTFFFSTSGQYLSIGAGEYDIIGYWEEPKPENDSSIACERESIVPGDIWGAIPVGNKGSFYAFNSREEAQECAKGPFAILQYSDYLDRVLHGKPIYEGEGVK